MLLRCCCQVMPCCVTDSLCHFQYNFATLFMLLEEIPDDKVLLCLVWLTWIQLLKLCRCWLFNKAICRVLYILMYVCSKSYHLQWVHKYVNNNISCIFHFPALTEIPVPLHVLNLNNSFLLSRCFQYSYFT